jgi:hypothetical protein
MRAAYLQPVCSLLAAGLQLIGSMFAAYVQPVCGLFAAYLHRILPR